MFGVTPELILTSQALTEYVLIALRLIYAARYKTVCLVRWVRRGSFIKGHLRCAFLDSFLPELGNFGLLSLHITSITAVISSHVKINQQNEA